MAEEEKQAAETPTNDAPEIQTGRVKWFSNARGFGFITPDGGGDDLFVHQAAIHAEGFRSLCEGEAVEYSVEQGDDGRYRAINVTGPQGAYVQGTSSRSRHGGRSSSKKAGNSCFTCGEPGHVARECTNPAGKRTSSSGSSASCFTCGQPGHFARDCSSAPPATSA